MHLLILLLLLNIVSCSSDPFDPPIGARIPRPGAERYLKTRNDISQTDKDALLNYAPCSLAALKELSNSPAREVRFLVAANHSVDMTILEKLINDKEPAVRQAVAGNPRTPRSLLLKLKNDPDKNVRWGLPRNPNWTTDEIREMYKNKDSWLLIASNTSTSHDILEELSEIDDYGIRTSLANNSSIPDSVVKKLAQKGDSSVKIMLTYNKATSEEVLSLLAKDANPDVRRYANSYLEKRQRK